MNDRRPHDAIYPDQAKEAQAQAIAEDEYLKPSSGYAPPGTIRTVCKNEGDHAAHTWNDPDAKALLYCNGKFQRAALLDDLAVLKLHLEDDLINDGQAGEALARVVGALHLTPEEEDWLEGQ